MTPENLQAQIHAIACWAREEIDRIVYAGTRPLSVCGGVEAATREAAIAHANEIVHAAEIAEIESVLSYVTECLSADLSHRARPPAPSPLHERALSTATAVV